MATQYKDTFLFEAPLVPQTGAIVPIIIVPGIMGTRLMDPQISDRDRNMVWNPTGALAPPPLLVGGLGGLAAAGWVSILRSVLGCGRQYGPLALRFGRLANDAPLEPRDRTDIPNINAVEQRKAARVPNFGHLVADFYDQLAFALNDDAFRREMQAATGRSVQVYACGYDWRQDNLVSARRLAGVVEQAKRETGAEKVILVAHSMGGLVSRAYCKSGGEANVLALVLLASPTHGASQAYRALKTGLSWGTMDFPWNLLFFEADLASYLGSLAVRRPSVDFVRRLASVYQLLPTEHFCRSNPGWLSFNTYAGAPLTDASNANALYRHAHIGFTVNRTAALTARVQRNLDLREQLDRLLSGYMPSQTHVIYSSHRPTETRLSLRGGGLSGVPFEVVRLPFSPGDGTVPAFSGQAAGWGSVTQRYNVGDGSIQPSTRADHSGLPNDPAVIARVKEIIRQVVPAVRAAPPVHVPIPIRGALPIPQPVPSRVAPGRRETRRAPVRGR
jgi:pimeloyl-ACP methyl ester carboxylesterase